MIFKLRPSTAVQEKLDLMRQVEDFIPDEALESAPGPQIRAFQMAALSEPIPGTNTSPLPGDSPAPNEPEL